MVKNGVIQVRLSDENVATVSAKTKLMGLSNSAWVRMLILRELGRDGEINSKWEISDDTKEAIRDGGWIDDDGIEIKGGLSADKIADMVKRNAKK